MSDREALPRQRALRSYGGITAEQREAMEIQLRVLAQKATALADRLRDDRCDSFGGRLEDMLTDACYVASYIPSRVRENEMARLDARDQVAT